MKVKLLIIQEIFTDDDSSHKILRDSVGDWEEITDDDLKFLRANMHLLPKPFLDDWRFKYVLLINDETKIKDKITSIKDFFELEKIKREKERLEKEKKRKEKEIKRTKEQELKLLEELKKKYEDG